MQISKFDLGFKAQLYMENSYNHDIYFVIYCYLCYLANLTEQAEGNVS